MNKQVTVLEMFFAIVVSQCITVSIILKIVHENYVRL